MTEREPPKDLDRYLPDEATAEAAMNGPVEFTSKADPKLVARLDELNRMSSNPDLLRPAPPSEAVYAVADVRGASPDDTTLPRAQPKVQLTLPSETPTQPSLKRFEGEPDVPGVVKGTSSPRPGGGREEVPRRGLPGVSPRTAVAAVLAVLVPVLIVIVLMGREIRKGERAGAASAPSAVEPSPVQGAPLPATPTAAPKPVLSAAPPPSIEPSATPTGTAGAAVPLPRGATPKPPRRIEPDPYDAPPTPPAPAATTAPQATAVPSAAPPATAPTATVPPPTTPSAPPSTTGPRAPAQKPEF